MTTTEIIEKRLKEKNIQKIALANFLGITKSNLGNKLRRDNFQVKELTLICKFLNMKLIIKDDDETDYTIEYTE